MTEFEQFYDSMYGEESNPRFVTEEKAYGFVSYHAQRKNLTKKETKS